MNMVNALLDIDQIDERGPAALQREAVNPAEALHDAVEQVFALAEEKSITLTSNVKPSPLARFASAAPSASADRDKLVRVLVNLLGNAIKFSHTGASVRARSGITSGNDGTPLVWFSVQDNGIGMSDANNIFTEGVRLDPTPPAAARRGSG